MSKRKPTVGLLGYQPSDPRILRIIAAGEQKVVWVATHNQAKLVEGKIRNDPPDILVVNPRHFDGLDKLNIPTNITVVRKTNPFGEREIDTSPVS